MNHNPSHPTQDRRARSRKRRRVDSNPISSNHPVINNQEPRPAANNQEAAISQSATATPPGSNPSGNSIKNAIAKLVFLQPGQR